MARVEIDRHGTKHYMNDIGDLHREDGPALIYKTGGCFWYLNSKLHWFDGPACRFNGGEVTYAQHGRTNRIGKPAEDEPGGFKRWWENGEIIWPKLK